MLKLLVWLGQGKRESISESPVPRTVSNTYAQKARHKRVQITCNTSGAYHVQHVVLHATWHEGTAQLLSLTEFKSYLL